MKKINDNLFIGDLLGKGGMGRVYKGKLIRPDHDFEKIIAVKLVNESFFEDSKILNSFINEAKVCGKLNHPNICQILDIGTYENIPYIMMEYIEGHNLKELIQKAKANRHHFSIELAIHIVEKICIALKYAHEGEFTELSGIIHNDISPHNIMIGQNGEVKLLDFGISRMISSDYTQTSSYKGKLSYLPPEVLGGEKYDVSHDIYSLGLVFYEMLALEKVYRGNFDYEIIENVKNADVSAIQSFRSDITNDLESLITNWINKNKKKRPSSANDLLQELKKLKCYKRISSEDTREAISQLLNEYSHEDTVIDTTPQKVPFYRKFKYIKHIFGAISLAVIITCTIIFFPNNNIQTYTENSNLKIVAEIKNKYINISPPKLQYDNISKLIVNELKPVHCDMLLFFALSKYGIFNESPNLTPKRSLNKEFLKTVIMNCPKKGQRFYIQLLMNINQLFAENNSKSKNDLKIKYYPQMASEKFKETVTFLDKQFRHKGQHLDTLILTGLIMDSKHLFQTSELINVNLLSISTDKLKDEHDCIKLGDLIYSGLGNDLYGPKPTSGKLNLLIVSKDTGFDIIGLNNKTIVIKPHGKIDKSLLFQHGMCHYVRNKGKLETVQYWTPVISDVKEWNELDL